MPKTLSYTPAWLKRPAPGSEIFSEKLVAQSPLRTSTPSNRPNGAEIESCYQGPRRLIAHRGTEIFVVAGNKLRWADLRSVKDDWEHAPDERERRIGSKRSKSRLGQGNDAAYRLLAIPVYHAIRQIILSPSEQLLAVLTEHTVHVAVLPDSSHLRDQDHSALKLRVYQLGPTTHVIPQSPLVSALWHPLSASSSTKDCLVTVTAEAAVRLWELDWMNRWTFDKPTLAIDLKKLIDGASCEDDFEPSGFGKSQGFSADVFDMEVSSACFGGSGSEVEDGWAAMTLWISMRNADVYALCPLLPSMWRPSSTTVPALSTSVVAKTSSIDDTKLRPEEKRYLRQQYEWVQDLDQEDSSYTDESDVEAIRRRPSNPSPIPRLQGPFDLNLGELADDCEASDIYVIAAKLDVEGLMSVDEDDYARVSELAEDSLAATLICLATTNGDVHVLLDTEGVSGQWLPRKSSGTFAVPDSDYKELLYVETLSSDSNNAGLLDKVWPMFSVDPSSRYNLYFTTAQETMFISFKEWVPQIDGELNSPPSDSQGLHTRVENTCDGSTVFCDTVLNIAHELGSESEDLLSMPVLLRDVELGCMLLSMTSDQPYAVIFDDSEFLTSPLKLMGESNLEASSALWDVSHVKEVPLAIEDGPAPRVPYRVPRIFLEQPTAPMKHFLTLNVPQRQKITLKQELKLSPATMEIMNSAHRIISQQYSQLEEAAADLFRKCERLREDLGDQVKTMSELADRMQRLSSQGDDEGDKGMPKPGFENRLDEARERQRRLVERHATLRRRIARSGTTDRELSVKELGWTREVDRVAQALQVDEDEGEHAEESNRLAPDTPALNARMKSITELSERLLAESKKLQIHEKAVASPPEGLNRTWSNASKRSSITSRGVQVPSKFQKAKITEAMGMVEREGAVIDAVMARLEKLQVG